MKARILALVTALQIGAPHAFSYQFLQTETPDGDLVDIRWFSTNFPVRYYVNGREPLDFSLQEAVDGIAASFEIGRAHV